MLPLQSLLSALAGRGVAVLQAPPGAGKTTQVPPALLGAPWLGSRKILMLEPRRLAARAAARYMARQMGEQVGETVGYRVRMDTRVGPRTRIEVVTEGVLTRMLQADSTLDEVCVVIFDEFHERSLHADLGLALTLQTRALLRDDLRILVMSATLDGRPVAALIGDDRGPAPIITSEGRTFPVETINVPRRPDQHLEQQVAAVVRRAMTDHEGDVLAFLPGAAEITRTARLLGEGSLSFGSYVAPLHGSLDQAAQDRAIAPSRPGERKVVLATTIAQTSLTIEGVRIVVDSGYLRAPRFSPRTGMTRLETLRVSRASADQRRGRAGRTAPGVCYRLWDAHEEQGLIPFDRPEIMEADLAPLALELAAAGIRDPDDLRWLDTPPTAALAQARELLTALEMLDGDGRVTDHGLEAARLGAHPRIAHMLLRARSMGDAAAVVACDLAALLGQRDIVRVPPGTVGGADADLQLRLDVLRVMAAGGKREQLHGSVVDRAAAHHAAGEALQWRRILGIRDSDGNGAYEENAAGTLVALAYPERVAQRRASGGDRSTARFVLRNGGGATLGGAQSLHDAEYLAVAELGGAGSDARIQSAARLTLAEVEELFAAAMQREQVVEWDRATRSVRTLERMRLGALVIREGPLRDPDPGAVLAALLAGVRADGLSMLSWSEAARSLRARLAFAHAVSGEWPDVSDDALAETLEAWLGPVALDGAGRVALQRLDLAGALQSLLTWQQRAALDDFAPTHWAVPSGSRIRIDYTDPASPVLAVRLQELFGMHETPRIGGGRVSLTIHLLSPARRPVQVTQDLAGFWRTGYFDVKKELKGRYPKHYWPDDPMVAEARRGTRKPSA